MSDGNGDDGRNGNNLLDVEGAPGVEYLSPAERALCSQLHLLPGYYLVIKVINQLFHYVRRISLSCTLQADTCR